MLQLEDIFSIMTAGVCWMTWWSPTECYIHTKIINMNWYVMYVCNN
jgi:hypothetical protein